MKVAVFMGVLGVWFGDLCFFFVGESICVGTPEWRHTCVCMYLKNCYKLRIYLRWSEPDHNRIITTVLCSRECGIAALKKLGMLTSQAK